MRSWPALYFLSYPSQHLLLDSRPREATSTVLRQNRTQASPSASHSNFSKAFWKPSISSNFEHIFSQNYLRMIAFPTLNLKCFKRCTRALMLFWGFCLLGFCFVACLRAPLLLQTHDRAPLSLGPNSHQRSQRDFSLPLFSVFHGSILGQLLSPSPLSLHTGASHFHSSTWRFHALSFQPIVSSQLRCLSMGTTAWAQTHSLHYLQLPKFCS